MRTDPTSMPLSRSCRFLLIFREMSMCKTLIIIHIGFYSFLFHCIGKQHKSTSHQLVILCDAYTSRVKCSPYSIQWHCVRCCMYTRGSNSTYRKKNLTEECKINYIHNAGWKKKKQQRRRRRRRRGGCGGRRAKRKSFAMIFLYFGRKRTTTLVLSSSEVV